jgi:hypothetical protein
MTGMVGNNGMIAKVGKNEGLWGMVGKSKGMMKDNKERSFVVS